MSELRTPELQTAGQERTGRINAALGTLRHNVNVRKDIVATTIGTTLGAAMGGPEGAILGGYLGSLARKVYNAVDENGRRALAVAGEPVSRRVADSRHLVTVLVDAVKSKTVQMPREGQMNAESIRVDRQAKYSAHR